MNTAIVWQDTPETFHWFRTSWDVTAAKRILQAKKRLRVDSVNVSDIAPLVGNPPVKNEDGSISFSLLTVHVDWDRAATDEVDPSIPIIFAYTKKGTLLPIDGYHRIAKAVLQGLTTLPCVVLTKAESKKVRQG